jgi:hypothetical protein
LNDDAQTIVVVPSLNVDTAIEGVMLGNTPEEAETY